MKPPLALALAASLAPGAALGASAPPSFEREIRVDGAGRVAVRLDRDVYEGARGDLGDLRVLDARGREVAFVVDRASPGGRSADVRPAVRNRGWRADGSATAVLDFGGRVAKRRLELRLSGLHARGDLQRAQGRALEGLAGGIGLETALGQRVDGQADAVDGDRFPEDEVGEGCLHSQTGARAAGRAAEKRTLILDEPRKHGESVYSVRHVA